MQMIFLTWTDQRGFLPTYGKPIAALWAREGGARALAAAQAYADKRNARAGNDLKVYATSAYELFAVAKAEALAAHNKE
jgi:hypothetical protein